MTEESLSKEVVAAAMLRHLRSQAKPVELPDLLRHLSATFEVPAREVRSIAIALENKHPDLAFTRGVNEDGHTRVFVSSHDVTPPEPGHHAIDSERFWLEAFTPAAAIRCRAEQIDLSSRHLAHMEMLSRVFPGARSYDNRGCVLHIARHGTSRLEIEVESLACRHPSGSREDFALTIARSLRSADRRTCWLVAWSLVRAAYVADWSIVDELGVRLPWNSSTVLSAKIHSLLDRTVETMRARRISDV